MSKIKKFKTMSILVEWRTKNIKKGNKKLQNPIILLVQPHLQILHQGLMSMLLLPHMHLQGWKS